MKNLINTIRGMYESKEESIEEAKKLDAVNKDALKKDFDDRDDKDIDNDGDADDSDEYLHNRRKAVSKAIKGEGKGEKVEVNPKLDEEALEENLANHAKDFRKAGYKATKNRDGSYDIYTGVRDTGNHGASIVHKAVTGKPKDWDKGSRPDYNGHKSSGKGYKAHTTVSPFGGHTTRISEELALDEAKVTHSDLSAPGKGKALKDMSKDDHIKSIEHHEREMSIADKKGQSWNVKHHQMMAKVHRVNAQGGSSMMHKEDKEVTEGKIYASDYETSSEKSQFGGHRPVVKNKKTGKTMYHGSTSYHKPEHAKGHADAYLQGYAQYGEYGANKQSQSYQQAHQKHVKEGLEIQEGLETRIGGGKVPVGQHTLHYKTDKSHKYISNSIKERDPNAKITGKDGHTIVHATAQAHSSVIKSLRDFRTNGVVHDTQASNMREETMNEGTMSRYELIKKAAKKINRQDNKAARDAAKGIKKDKDLKKVKHDPADMDEAKVMTAQDHDRAFEKHLQKHDRLLNTGGDGLGARVERTRATKKAQYHATKHKELTGKLPPSAEHYPGYEHQDRHESFEYSEEVITEGNAAMELKKYANSKGGIDKQDFIAISNMLAKGKSAKELAMVLKVQDTDPRDKALEIISKNDNKLYHEILAAARDLMPKKTIKKPNLRAQYEEVELEEDYKQDAKNAPFTADPEKKKKQKNSDKTETKPMSRAKQLAKKGMVSEEEMTDAQKRKREEIVKSMKDKASYFERKYGDRAKDVMYATATKMAMKEGYELTREMFEAYVAPSDGGQDGGGTPPVYTTKKGTNYKNGKAIGPVSDPDGGSATPTPAPKKEDYNSTVAATSKAYVDKKAAPDSIAAPINKVRSTMKASSEKKAMSAYNKVFGKK